MEELASHGYILLAVAHPFYNGNLPLDSGITAEPDGSIRTATAASTDIQREVFVGVFMPSDSTLIGKPMPYISGMYAKLNPEIDKVDFGAVTVTTHTAQDIKMPVSTDKYPVVIFSPGFRLKPSFMRPSTLDAPNKPV